MPGRRGISAMKPILQMLDESGLALSSSAIHYNLPRWGDWGEYGSPPSRATIDRALRSARELDLVDRPDEADNLYQINERGRAFLNGDMTLQELEETVEE